MTQIDRTEGLVGNTAIKAPVRAATTSAITLSGEQTIDGVAVVTGDRVLVKNQASSVNNGIYDVDTGAWTRSQDADGSYDIVKGTLVMVTDGTTNGATIWRQSTANDITIGTSALVFQNAVFSDSQTVTFTQAGTGAVQRTSQDKMRDLISVKDFGAVGDNTTDDRAAIQAAIDFAKTQHHGTIYFPNATGYKVNGALDVTGTSGIKFLGEAGNNSSYATLYPYHTGHVFDCSDSSFLTFENISIRTFDNTVKPSTAWFLARNAAGASAGNHHFSRCASYGKFANAVVYSYASESNEYHNCYFANQETAAKGVCITGYNILGLSSTFITIATGSKSNVTANFFGGSIAMFASGNADALYIEALAVLRMYGTELFCSDGATGGRSLINIDTTNSPSTYLNFEGVVGENFGGAANPSYGVYLGGGAAHGASACASLSFKDGRIATTVKSIYGTDDVDVNGMTVDNFNNVGSGTGLSLYKLTGAKCRGDSYLIRNTCDSSFFETAIAAVTFSGTHTNCVVYDPNTGSFSPLRGETLTVGTNPADVVVNDSTATTLFDIRTYCAGGQMVEFTVFDSTTILGHGRAGRPNSGANIVALLTPSAGAGLALSISGNDVQLTHTTGAARTISIRMQPPTASAA